VPIRTGTRHWLNSHLRQCVLYALPVRSQLGELQPEGLPLQEEDEDVELDPARVPRPYPRRGAE
jgi:hypothetical protein